MTGISTFRRTKSGSFFAYRTNYQLLGSRSMGADQGKASKKFRRFPSVDLKNPEPFWKSISKVAMMTPTFRLDSTAARCRSRNRINVGTQAQLFGNLTVAWHHVSLFSADRAQLFTASGGRTGASVAPTGTVRA